MNRYGNWIIPERLSKEETAELYKNLTPENRGILAERNLALALRVAKYYANVSFIDEEDAFSIASVALVKASQTFNPDLGFTFGTYSVKVMSRAVLNYIHKHRNDIELSAVSFNSPVKADSDSEEELLEFIPDDVDIAESVISEVTAGDINDIVDVMLSRYSDRSKSIILDYIGGMNIVEVADKHGCTRQWVSYLMVEFRSKLRRRLQAWGI